MARTAPLRTKTVTAARAARLYRLLRSLAEEPVARPALLRKLKLDARGFYRELELLRGFGIRVELSVGKYVLRGELTAALEKLPFPDPKLSFAQALELSTGNRPAQKALRDHIDKLTGPSPRKSR